MHASRLFAVSITGLLSAGMWQCGSSGNAAHVGTGGASGAGAMPSGGATDVDASTGGTAGTSQSGGIGGGGGAIGGSAGNAQGGNAGATTGGTSGIAGAGLGGATGTAGTATGGAAGSSSGGAPSGGAGGSSGTGGAPPVCTEQVSAGGEHTCAVKLGGSVWCWGADEYGQLGDGTSTGTTTCYGQEGCNPTPAMVPGLSSGFAQVACGFTHTCARTATGELYCWGENTGGNLGDGTTDGVACFTTIAKCKPTPQPVTSLGSEVASVSVGYGPEGFDCVRKTDSTAWCWGGGGRFGSGPGATPKQVTALGTSVVQVSSGGGHACALKTDGHVWCWGRNDVGQLGDGGTTTPASVLDPVEAVLDYGKKYIAVSAGMQHACAVREDHELFCWGGNSYGEVGIGVKSTSVPIPQLIVGIGLTARTVEAGDGNTCSQKTDLTYWCWGSNSNGELGTGGTSSPSAPAPVSNLSNTYFGLDLGHQHGCAIKTADGSLWCWGEQSKGQIGTGGAYAPDVCTSLPQFCTRTPTKTLLSCP